MASSVAVYIFGDQSEDYAPGLKDLILSHELDPILDAFLAQSYKAIVNEISRVPEPQDWILAQSTTLLDLLPPRAPHYVPLEHALTTVYQIGLFLHHRQRARGVYPSPSSSRTYLLGLCTGSLTAAAISCSRSLSELLSTSVKVVCLSFRAGLLATDVGNLVCSGIGSPCAWALICCGLSLENAEAIIHTFVQREGIPCTSRPYVSSVSSRGLTISGPPGILSLLRQGEELSTIRTTWLPVRAPYHASHLYSTQIFEAMLDEIRLSNLCRRRQQIPLLSCVTERKLEEGDLRSVLLDALEDIFLRPMQFAKASEALSGILRSSNITNVRVIPIATNSAHNILDALDGIAVEIESVLRTAESGANATVPSSIDAGRPQIAVVGMAGRFPGAGNMYAFWDLIHQGLDVHKETPGLRWNVKTHVDPCGERKNTSQTPYGCWLDHPELFDARFFGISPREANQIDPAQRLALLTAYEAMEDGGIVPGTTPSTRRDRIGIIYGVTSNDWMETNSAQDIDTYFIPGGNRAFIPGRINYCFKLSGPSYSVDTACSSSLASIHLACNLLWKGEVDTMLAGGTNVLTNPDFTSGLDRGHFLSRTGNCKTFDETADGYCRGEGVVTFVLKRLEDALADHDPIQGVIVNVSTNHSAEAASITKPNVPAQASLFRRVIQGTNPADISYVEMHGTGTQAGDTCEMSAVLEVFAPREPGTHRPESQPLYVGAVKSNVGHGEAVAGACSLAKVLLMMKNDTIPPHCGIKTTINHRFPKDLFDRGVRIADAPVSWKRPREKPRRALVNNFSAAGGNTALLLEDGPQLSRAEKQDPRGSHVVAISARSATSLEANVRSLVQYLEKAEESGEPVSLSSLSYTTTARRMHHVHRIAVTGSTIGGIKASLLNALDRKLGEAILGKEPEIIFVFTGQGSQYLGMGQSLFEEISSFHDDILHYDNLARSLGFASILPIVSSREGKINNFMASRVQLAIICLQMALTRLFKRWGIIPRAVIGHSLGQYAALNAAGVLTDADTIFLVGRRGQLLEKMCQSDTHAMLAVKSSPATINPFLRATSVEIACVNGISDVVLSGIRNEIAQLQERLRAKMICATVLDLPYAFHSSQVDAILNDLRTVAKGVPFHQPKVPVICPLTGSVIHQQGVLGPQYLVDHCRKRVDMVGAVRAATNEGLVGPNTILFEVGHHDNISRALESNLGGKHKVLRTLRRNIETWTGLAETVSAIYMAGKDIQWRQYHRGFESSQHVLSLPAYNWDLKPYWIQYINDWSLRKGDPTPQSTRSTGPVFQQPRSKPELRSSLVHEVLSEVPEGDKISIVVQTDTSRAGLESIVHGHKINGIPLCTPSVYVDIALTLGTYIRDAYYQGSDDGQIEVAGMSIEKPLIPQSPGPHLLRTTFETVGKERQVNCRFATVTMKGETVVVHARCTILFSPSPIPYWVETWKADSLQTLSKLQEGLKVQQTYRFNSMMVYRMVDAVAEFHREYRGLDDVILDSDMMAASGTISFPNSQSFQERTFHVYPPYLDVFTQLAGFVMNANAYSDLDKEVFVNHGWSSLQLYATIVPERTYLGIVRMVRKDASQWEGTLLVLDGEQLVCKVERLTLLGIPKRLLHGVLASTSQNLARVTGPTQSNINSAHSVSTPMAMTAQSVQAAGTDHGTDWRPKVLDIIAEESGISRETLKGSTAFASIGVDSLLSLLITSRLRDDIGFDLGVGATIFDSYLTVEELLDGIQSYFGPPTASSDSSSGGTSTPGTLESTTKSLLGTDPMSSDTVYNGLRSAQHSSDQLARPCTPIVLQQAHGLDKRQMLFLFPDGSGSARSYSKLPRVSDNVAMIGLSCPYRTTPEEMTCSLDALITSYLSEIRRRQPTGPYNFGGWSAGGILAYRAAQRILAEGETVDNLLLIDSPPPNHGLDQLPQRFYDHCDTQGVFDQNAQSENASSEMSRFPSWLIPHFRATINLLHDYHAQPLPHGALSQVCIFWAKKCVLDGMKFAKLESAAGDSEGMKFLTQPQADFSAGEWAELFPGTEVRVYVVEADHFSMMFGEPANLLSQYIAAEMVEA